MFTAKLYGIEVRRSSRLNAEAADIMFFFMICLFVFYNYHIMKGIGNSKSIIAT